jgi:outer membrane protein assembly factor BamB
MKDYSALRRWLSAVLTVVVFAAILGAVAWSRRASDQGHEAAEEGKSPEVAHAWPMFGGTIQRNMVNTRETGVPTDWSVEEGKEKNIKWSAVLGSKAYGGPVVADGKVFVGTNNGAPRDPKIKDDKGIVLCFRQRDGKFLWQGVFDKLEAGRVNDWPEEGICSTPFVEDKLLYFINNRCEVVCATTEGLHGDVNKGVKDEKYKGEGNADVVWHLDMMKKLNVFPHNLASSSPLVVGNRIFVVTSNGVDEGHINIPDPEAPSFIAVDKQNGDVIWKSNAPGKNIMHGQWSSPVYAEVEGKPEVIFPGGDGYLRAFTPDNGELIWKFFCNPQKSVYKLGGQGTRSDFLAAPVVYDNKVYIGVGQDPEHEEGVGHFWCIDLVKANKYGATNKDKDHDVSAVHDNFDPAAKDNKHSALAWHYGGPGDPQKLGRNYYFGRTMSTAAVHDGLVYIAELAGYLHCLDAKTGKHYWQHEMDAACWCSPYWVDGKVYIGNDDHKVLIFKDGKTKKLINEVDMGGTVRATPTVVDGVLYVMTENKLYAIK